MKKSFYILIMFVIFTGINYAQNLDSGLVAWYPLNGTPNDSSGFGQHGTIYGNVTFGVDRFGNNNSCYVGNGSTFIKVNNFSHFPIGNSSRSTCLWLKCVLPHPGGYRTPFCYGAGTFGTRWGYHRDPTTLGLEWVNGSLTISDTPDSNWHFVVFTYPLNGLGSSAVKMYLDGVLQNTTVWNPVTSFNTGTEGCFIGAIAINYWYSWVGKLDDIRMYNRELSQQEVSILYGLFTAPTLISPSNNSTGVSVTPTLVWNTVSGATGYKVKISSDSTFFIVTDSANVTTNQYTVPSGKLNYSTKYYWRVAGYNSYVVGVWSSIWNFTTINPLPLQVTLISPANNSTGMSLTPTLLWNTATNATSYKVEVSPLNNFSLIVDSATVTTNQRTIPAGKLNVASTYFWRVRGVNIYGNGPWSTVWNFSTLLTGVQQLGSEIPKEYKLYDNYPNPFNPVTTIKFDIQKQGLTKIIIYNILGKEVSMHLNKNLNAGTYQIIWDANSYPSGVYYYSINVNEFNKVNRMILLK